MLLNLNGVELEFDIFDADTAENYEVALKTLEEAGKEAQLAGETGKLSENIRMQCEGVFDFIDDIFGDGTSKEVFGEKTNLREALNIANKVINSVEEQRKEFEEEQASSVFAVAQKPNRAQRRARK